MDDDFDIYEDLPLTCDLKDNGASSGNNENISKECEKFKREVTELTTKLQKLQKINETLEVNLSSLLKTAKAEIARKDKMIDELRRQVDDKLFKRGYFNRNRREINDRPVQQVSASNTQELNNVQAEYTKNSTIENSALVKTISTNINQFDYDQDIKNIDYESYSKKRYEAKHRTTNLTEPFKLTTTVFAERLRKRITEEEEEQKKKLEEQERQNLLLENNHENNKEINVDNKENQSHFSIWNSNIDNTNSKCKETEHDYTDNINNPESTAAYTVDNQQRIVVNTKLSKKRTDDSTDMPCNKRRKLETEHNTCITKDYLPKKEDVLNGYDDKIISNTNINKFDYKEDINSCIERNDPHCNVQYERDYSKSRLNDSYYKRKEHYKKSGTDCNYSKENAYYHEKDKYNRSRNRSPILKYSDRKQKYYDDRYRDHRDKFDRRHFQNKEETPIVPNKKFYDLRHKDKIKFNGKYNSTDFYSPRHKEIRYSDSRVSRSASHERSKSRSRERTNHKINDKRSSKTARNNNNSEKYASTSIRKKDEIHESKAARKKDDILVKTDDKSVKINNTESLEGSKIVDNSYIKSSINIENKKVQIAARDINEDNENKSENELVFSKPLDACTTNSRVFIKEENNISIEYKKNENNDRVTGVENTVQIATNVNINLDTIHISVDGNKQDCVITSVDKIADEKLKCDKHIVQHGTADEEASQENNAIDKHDVEMEELPVCNKLPVCFSNEVHKNKSDTSKNEHSSAQNNLENQTSILNDIEEPSVVKPQQKNEQDSNANDQIKFKDFESKKKSSERDKSKIVVLARRRKCAQFADNDASMIIVVTSNSTNADTDLKNNTENNLSSGACKVSRSCKNVL